MSISYQDISSGLSAGEKMHVVPGAGFFIDNFIRGAEYYFLTHYHSDHMNGLKEGWNNGTIFTGEITARALIALKKIDPANIKIVTPGEDIVLGSPAGAVHVTTYEANHCPGSLMFRFDVERGLKILHTGDFRYSADMAKADFGKIDMLYLDATYDSPRYEFPTGEEALESAMKVIEKYIAKVKQPRPPIFLATYTFGKERYIEEIYNRFGLKVYAPDWRIRSYKLLDYNQDAVTDDVNASDCRVYARWYFEGHFRKMPYYGSRRRLVIIPTGWAVDLAENPDSYHYVPDSDHCDYGELTSFVKKVAPGHIIKTHSLDEND